ncbi:hypothetical protein PR202_ga01732 [Eleusine coracana subsp. coracana]|uniref:PHD finger protein ALFIN-LIKE n=1 Tax=Eleusine coracana subsp. coracana TaxID=191504 RepID=A0AAV5BI33_ELECO|nr:hypothetical protein PR202_ga01045 [Eleusine coracana subsp. coracana]GJM85923.1 hypothetical protein PR202_ga01732 [Eleusine coracana subsp. coracana]
MDGDGAGGAAAVHHHARSPEDVFRDFRARRAGIVKALTTDVEKFYQQCDPEKENLCLYGLPNETWEVTLPAEEVPPELPEPALGINFAVMEWLKRIGCLWLQFIVMHGYCLLRSTLELDLDLIRKPDAPHPACVVDTQPLTQFSGLLWQPSKQHNSNSKPAKPAHPKDEEDSGREDAGDEDQAYLCGSCGESYANGEFWICCDICEKWFHGKCVRITPAKAEHIKQYKCPGCSSKRSRE